MQAGYRVKREATQLTVEDQEPLCLCLLKTFVIFLTLHMVKEMCVFRYVGFFNHFLADASKRVLKSGDKGLRIQIN